MIKVPKGLRLHIGVFGRRNVGKSSILNRLVGQDVSIVSEVAGTTTDPVEKVMEFKPLGPVVFIDTAGIDDVGALGKARVQKTRQITDRTELAIIVTDQWTQFEDQLVELFKKRSVPIIAAANKSDLRKDSTLEEAAVKAGVKYVVTTCADGEVAIGSLREAVIAAAPGDFLSQSTVSGDLVTAGELIVLVTPIDLEAPKGRLILPQVQMLRDILDKNAYAIVVKQGELADALGRLKEPPALVVTDSQAFREVAAIVPKDIPLTSFSIVYARFKGDIDEFTKSVRKIDSLTDGDKVLIAEACSHHPVDGDIGRVKLPRLLKKYTKRDLDIKVVAGRDFPEDLSPYKLVIHCGSCMFNRKELMSRIDKAKQAGVPITNYGVAIAYLNGILDRALRPFAMDRTAAGFQ